MINEEMNLNRALISKFKLNLEEFIFIQLNNDFEIKLSKRDFDFNTQIPFIFLFFQIGILLFNSRIYKTCF